MSNIRHHSMNSSALHSADEMRPVVDVANQQRHSAVLVGCELGCAVGVVDRGGSDQYEGSEALREAA